MKKKYLLLFCICLLVEHSYPQLPGASPALGITVAGGNGSGSAPNQLINPRDVFVDAGGNIYIPDAGNDRVQKFAPGALEGITVAGGNGRGSAPNQLSSPSGVFVDASGNIYVADALNHRIQKWASGDTAGTTVAGGNGAGIAANQLDSPLGVFVDGAGNIYISDSRNNRIQRWAAGATEGITLVGHRPFQIFTPVGIFVDVTGNIYVADMNFFRIQKYAPGDSIGITVAGGRGLGPAANQLFAPGDVFVDANGDIYVADVGNYRIQKWTPGALEGITVAGGNGQGSAANQLSFPWGVFVDTSGDIYVADSQNGRVQKFTDNNVVALSCPPDLIVSAPSCNNKAIISWTEPRDTFPSTIQTPENIDPRKRTFSYMGTLNGHGYYKSTSTYQWTAARSIAKMIGANGHLVTITSPEENNFIFNQFKGTGYAPWIGLFTKRPDRFRWVNNEPVTYTNWAPGEPNNSGGSARNVTEPYARLSSVNGFWNDQRDDLLPFIIEYEKPLVRHKQLSGPKNGSRQMPGVYSICYERRNLVTGKRDTCCFNVTVTCNPSLINEIMPPVAADEISKPDITESLGIIISPNPGTTFFRIYIKSNNSQDQVSMQLSDVSGRIIETRSKLNVNQTIELGRNLKPGVYFVQVRQGSTQAVKKVIKR